VSDREVAQARRIAEHHVEWLFHRAGLELLDRVGEERAARDAHVVLRAHG